VKYDGSRPIQAAGGLPSFASWIMSRRGAIEQVATRNMSPDRTIKVLLNCFDKVPALFRCTGNSIWRAVMGAVELGLEPGGALSEAHLVPYGDKCTLIVDYKGLEALCYRSGMVKSITSSAVYVGDTFIFRKGLNPTLDHEPCGEDDPKKITHAYCVVKLSNGGEVFEVLTRKQIERIRQISRSGGSGPWVDFYEAMCRKTVIRQTLKHCPKSTEVQKALALEDRNDVAGSQPIFDAEVMDAEYVDQTETPPTRSQQVGDRLKTQVTQGGPQWQDDGPPADMDPAQNDPDLAFGE
jgi:recombination protein RecT